MSTPPRGGPGQRLRMENRQLGTRRYGKPADPLLWHLFNHKNYGWMAKWLATVFYHSSLVLVLDAGMFIHLAF